MPVEDIFNRPCKNIATQGAFVSTSMLHRLKNASAYFQYTISPLFNKTKHAFKRYIDDFILHTPTETRLVQYLDEYFIICCSFDLHLSVTKSISNTSRVEWCSKIVDGDRYHIYLQNIDALLTMEAPSTARELCQFMHCCWWVSNCVANLHSQVKPLDEILEETYVKAERRKRGR